MSSHAKVFAMLPACKEGHPEFMFFYACCFALFAKQGFHGTCRVNRMHNAVLTIKIRNPFISQEKLKSFYIKNDRR